MHSYCYPVFLVLAEELVLPEGPGEVCVEAPFPADQDVNVSLVVYDIIGKYFLAILCNTASGRDKIPIALV